MVHSTNVCDRCAEGGDGYCSFSSLDDGMFEPTNKSMAPVCAMNCVPETIGFGLVNIQPAMNNGSTQQAVGLESTCSAGGLDSDNAFRRHL